MPRRELLIIDHFENELAVIKYGHHTFTLLRSLLPRAAKEGDVIKLAVVLDAQASARRKKEARSVAGVEFEE
ncbi:DUF3006 domain-containing protein [Neomoorella humiferrea]|uniref:DUF3006 domain-containing protein n=1 Tax=Neomoorella humiferrea TaxID=676965 RepID=A0A2T0AQ62_9FIRM|nr:DUF3006 domain-containing protein [Moorella humiferrea]PRR71174.1 hypothetical protein MOHU_17200 [Moorella humiferrea]